MASKGKIHLSSNDVQSSHSDERVKKNFLHKLFIILFIY